jgi:membrane protease YdiL (CAAX protease family)
MTSEHVGGDTVANYLVTFSVAIGLAAGGFLASNLLSLPLLALFSFFDVTLQSTIGYATSTLLQGIAFITVVVMYMRYANHPNLLNIRRPSASNLNRVLRDLGWVIGGSILLLVGSQAVGIALQQFGLAPGTNQIVSAVRQDRTLALYLIVLSFVATGPGEETLFRGGVQGILRGTFSPVAAVVLSSMLFGLAHVTAVVTGGGASGVPGYVISAFVLGLVLGSLYEYTDNLLIPVLVHGAYNAVLFAQLAIG